MGICIDPQNEGWCSYNEREAGVLLLSSFSPSNNTLLLFCEQVSLFISLSPLLFPYLLYRCLNTTCCHVFEKFITGGSVDLLHCSREYEHGVDQRKLGTISYLHPANNNGWAWDQSRGKHGSFGRWSLFVWRIWWRQCSQKYVNFHTICIMIFGFWWLFLLYFILHVWWVCAWEKCNFKYKSNANSTTAPKSRKRYVTEFSLHQITFIYLL